MKLEPIPGIPGAVLGTPVVHGDSRGSFMEIFREDLLGVHFVQANHSHSAAGVLRGLHYHRKQADAWYVIGGEAQAMLADLRTASTSPAVVPVPLVGGEPQVLYIPPGVAHGFLAVTDVDLIYWVTGYYDASDEFGVAWDDATLSAPWRIAQPVLSGRDQANPPLSWDDVGGLWPTGE
ncbi:MAG TPA: dTDP-4-dehydrorhamnose 3,5-epimerase family protein [Actinomycetota bacterium]|nr:dTDP-4-dehydrorhamnose 3,5-epimerase family protein [Actinomycetota bacterium]